MGKSKQKLIVLFVALSTVLMAAGCDKPAEEPQAPESAEQAQADEAAAEEPAEAQRLVTIGFSVTEIVFALGAGEQVVAADKSSIFPEEAKKLATLDLFRNISAEPIIAQNPTLVLAAQDTNPKDALEKIKAADIEVVEIGGEATVDAAQSRIKKVAGLLGREQQADELIASMDAQIAQAAEKSAACDKPARAMFIYARGPNTVMVAGKGTAVTSLIELAGGKSVHGDIEDFKPMSAEVLVDANPDVILMTDGGLQSLGGIDGVKRLKGLGDTEAVKHGRVLTYDDAVLLSFGPRLGSVALELADALCLDASEPSAENTTDKSEAR